MKKVISVLMIAVVVAGCNSTPKKDFSISNVVAGRNLSKRATRTVRGYEIVKTYHLGRRIDPNNPNIMYEAGKMYVINRSPTWKLRPHVSVSNQAFKKPVHPLSLKFKNMEKQQELVAKRNGTAGKIGAELLEIRKQLQQTSEKTLKKDSLSDIKEIQESHGEIKRKIAELEL